MARGEISTLPSLLSEQAGWPGPLLRLHSSFGGLSRRLDLSHQEAGLLVGVISHREVPGIADPRNARRTDLGEVGVPVEPFCRLGAAIGVVVGAGLVI